MNTRRLVENMSDQELKIYDSLNIIRETRGDKSHDFARKRRENEKRRFLDRGGAESGKGERGWFGTARGRAGGRRSSPPPVAQSTKSHA